MSTIAKGKCLCGSISFEVGIAKKVFDVCHCEICRKWGGGPALSVDAAGGISFTGEQNISTFQSSRWAERGFCKVCGTHLFYRLRNAKYCNLPLGLVEDSENFEMQVQLFIDSKPRCYEFANQTEVLTAAEIAEKFGPPPSSD